ncbi:MAG TPA: DUF1566 domain-containing protein [Fluviicoccus sp.]|nr:DUF1566 domain-containing protein [Fluviicoccus sp.]
MLNDTGITQCWNSKFETGPCTREHAGDWLDAAQDALTGPDALAASGKLKKAGRGSAGFDFSKIGADGEKLPHDARNWSCVLDNRTGLMWEEHTPQGGLSGMDRYFEWYNSDDRTNGGFAGYHKQGASTEALINAQNEEELCGYRDWRLPDLSELIGLMDFSKAAPEPLIDTTFFPHTPADAYWTALPNAQDKSKAWYVDFARGHSSYGPKVNRLNVRLVRNADRD